MPKFWRKYLELKAGIVNLKTGTAFRCVIWQQKREFLVLRNAEILTEGNQKKLDGEVVVQLSEVEFIQVI